MDIIKSFVEQYKGKIDFYEMASKVAAQKLETLLEEAGIRAIVTYRAKNPKSLELKLRARNARREEKYETFEDIFTDISDLSGVRIALYFPGDKRKAHSLVSNNFTLVEPYKVFPESSKNHIKLKRFSGYWANHYRVNMKDKYLSSNQKKYAGTKIEIQVASVLMHAWSEVEHDLLYKPLSGRITDEELLILDELNGLVLSGEIALERLQKAGNIRIQSSKDKFKSQFDLASFLSTRFQRKGKPEISVIQVGNIELLYKLTKKLDLDEPAMLMPYLRSVKVFSETDKKMETISMQIIDRIISGDVNKYEIYRGLLDTDVEYNATQERAIEYFLQQWIKIESSLGEMTYTNNPRARNPFTLNNMQKLGFSKSLMGHIQSLRKVRNDIMKGNIVIDPHALLAQGDRAKDVLGRIDENKSRPAEQ
ncbi:MAG: GTP pyrophosphokinase family protein [Suipraeoptans sp.]